MDIIQAITQELKVEKWQVEAAVKLIDEGNTIPFISRYRKEATGSLNDEQLRTLSERLTYLRNLEDKKNQVLKSIEDQGKLTEELKKQIENSDMLMITEEEWNDDMTGFKYAFFHWNKLTEEQKNEDVNLLGTGYEDWLKSIERVGTLGVYSKDVIDDLDSITGCNEHKELGTSEDGNYKYYLSINKDAESDLTDEIEKIETTITEMTAFDPSKSVFDMPAENANPDAGNVGAFETTDIDGNAYTEKVFSDYDLTLVNCFTTWCSPCVNEMPDLDKLYQEMKEKGVGVVGMVIDSVGEDGTTDEDTVKKAQILKEKTGVTYPLLIPDAGNMNGRISGLSSFPESFFVDKDGNIVGDPIMGSKNLEDWKTAVEDALEKINSGK